MEPKAKRVLITGAEGLIGSILRKGLARRYNLDALTRTPQPFESRVVDISNLDALASACQGFDAIIHLAGASALNAPWEDVLENNIVGTRNIFEAARRAGVPSVVYASSGHVLGMEEEEAGPALYALEDKRVLNHLTPPRPDSLYAVSKIFGEAIGRYYSDVFSIRVICVRLGAVFPDDNPCSNSPGQGRSALLPLSERYPRIRTKWLSQRDCCELFSRCLEATHARWAVVFGTSNNPRQLWSLDEARRVLGYAPTDAAPVSCDHEGKANETPDPDRGQ
jgi:nucleoside-diphosphate-sugar epimerase